MLDQIRCTQMPVEAHIFFSHTHWDHIQGFPFFVPAFVPINKFHIYGAIAPDGTTIKESLSDQMVNPNFPVPLQIMGSQMKFYKPVTGPPDSHIEEISTLEMGVVFCLRDRFKRNSAFTS